MRSVWVLVAALAALAARADEPVSAADPRLYAEPSVDAVPTPFACTVATLGSGEECVFESLAAAAADPAKQAVENAAAAARLAGRLCPLAARHPLEPIPDPDVLSWCKRVFAEKSVSCGIDGTRPVLDADERFARELRLCYAALSEVLSRARMMATSSAPCCRCLVSARCLASGERCNADALSRALGGATVACAAERCGDACAARIPQPDPVLPPAPPPAAAPEDATAAPAPFFVPYPPYPCFLGPYGREVPCDSH